MSEFLIVRASRDNQQPILWLVWSTRQNEIIASGELSNRERLNELYSYANQRTTLLLLDSRDVLLTETEIPAGAARQIDAMLPYLLEDELAQDVEELHFSVLKKSAKKLQIAAIEKGYLREWLDDFSEVGVEVTKVIPDAQALPLLEREISALQVFSQWLFRKGEFESISIDKQWLNVFLDSDWRVIDESTYPFRSFTGKALEASSIVEDTSELPMEILAKGAIASSTNLLTGEFKSQSSIAANLKIWKPAVIAACLFLAVLTTQRLLEVNQYEEQAKAYRAESERIFRVIFPDKNRIPTVSYLKRQMEDEESVLSGGGMGLPLLDWLALLPDALTEGNAVEVNNIRYDSNRGELRLEVTMADFEAFEVVRSKLTEKFIVTQGPLDRKENRVSGNFVLRRKG